MHRLQLDRLLLGLLEGSSVIQSKSLPNISKHDSKMKCHSCNEASISYLVNLVNVFEVKDLAEAGALNSTSSITKIAWQQKRVQKPRKVCRFMDP